MTEQMTPAKVQLAFDIAAHELVIAGKKDTAEALRTAVAAMIARESAYRNALEHIAGSCEGRAAEVASTALKDAEAGHG